MKKFLTIALLTLGCFAGFAPGEAKAQSANYWLGLAQQWEAAAPRLTGNEKARALELARLYRSYAQQVGGGNANQPAKPQPQPQPKPAAGLTQQQIMQIALQSRQAAFNFISRTRPGRNGGYLIYFSRPPIYQGETQYTPNPRPYFVNAREAQREITRLTNNGNKITGMAPN